MKRGEVWMVDLGLAAKVRPCLLLTDEPEDDELALVTILSHTTSVRGSRWELRIDKHFLKSGAFHLQQIHSVGVTKLERRMGALTAGEMALVDEKLIVRLSIG